MNWDDLKLIDAAARMRSLSGAARALDISQPQLSRRLKGFEDKSRRAAVRPDAERTETD
jgi:DNA-binding transcriptional LysR family regulator